MYLTSSPALLLSAIGWCLSPARTDAATPSAGCATNPSPAPGSWDAVVNFDGGDYSHRYSYPPGRSQGNPAPLLLYFHGWGGSSNACGSFCSAADGRGYATISLTGIGSEYGSNNSWNGFGSNRSGTGAADAEALVAGTDNCGEPREDDRTCNVNAYDVGCYADCGGSCADDCWWTTCKDSVQQAVDVLEDFLDSHCVDEDRIYAVGCSNGGMFTYELANDARSAKYLAGISPQVGLPHYGYNRGPHASYKIHHLGFWGSRDGTVPPRVSDSNTRCTVPCRTSENRGWFYTSSECTMNKWQADYGLVDVDNNPTEYGIQSYNKLSECAAYTGAGDDAVVVGCIFSGGHICNASYMTAVTLDFFDANPKVGSGSPTTSSPTKSPSVPSPTTDAPTVGNDECSGRGVPCDGNCCSGCQGGKGPNSGKCK